MNADVVAHIYSFLPVRDPEIDARVAGLQCDICKFEICKKWVRYYSRIYPQDKASGDYYFHWLENDIGRWANNDRGLMFGVTTRYSTEIFHEMYRVLNADEAKELDVFLEKIYFS